MRSIVLIVLLLSLGCKPNKEKNIVPLAKHEQGSKITNAEPKTIPKDPLLMVSKNILVGKFREQNHDNFVLIPRKYADRTGKYLQKEALEAFIKMYEAAKTDDISLTIRSATRNFDYQKGIWERKWTGATILSSGINASKVADHQERALHILEYSSMPGTSRHHWGTDIDLNAFNNAYFEKGQGLKIFNWLTANAKSFGFCRPYTSKEHREGYNEEKWHWSYMPISQEYTRSIKDQVTYDDIKGFKGDDTAEKIDVINKYMLGINTECK